MSKIFIEDYKGQSIEYDVDYDKFVCDISVEDKYKKAKRGSLTDMRKEIDTFIKLNLEFKPIKAIRFYFGDTIFVTIEKIRTDGKFVVNSGSSRYDIVSQEDAAKFFKFDAGLYEEFKKSEQEMADVINNERKRHESVKNSIMAKLIPLNLPKYEI